MTPAKPRPWIPWAALLLLALSFSCAKAAKPVTAEEDRAAEAAEPVTPAEPVAVEPEPATTPAPAPEKPKPDPTTVYIDGGEGDKPRTRSLVEASRAERERRAKAREPVAVITNKTLPQFNKGKLTVADPKASGKKAGAAADFNKDEEQWRQRGLEIRLRWRESAERVKQLELDTAGWRRRFYAENDASVRERQIKPEWDRTLDELREARSAVETARKDLATFLEEGREAGALPGWLREGAELEPAEAPEPPSPTDSIEPPILEIDPRP